MCEYADVTEVEKQTKTMCFYEAFLHWPISYDLERKYWNDVSSWQFECVWGIGDRGDREDVTQGEGRRKTPHPPKSSGAQACK